jgi:hypothetical protein
MKWLMQLKGGRRPATGGLSREHHEHKVEIRQKAGLDSSNCKGEVSTTAGVAVLADTVVGRVKGWSQIMVQPE